ncbi:MAG: hypothetical protein Q9164_002409 [Protoblastenia rupestris]
MANTVISSNDTRKFPKLGSYNNNATIIGDLAKLAPEIRVKIFTILVNCGSLEFIATCEGIRNEATPIMSKYCIFHIEVGPTFQRPLFAQSLPVRAVQNIEDMNITIRLDQRHEYEVIPCVGRTPALRSRYVFIPRHVSNKYIRQIGEDPKPRRNCHIVVVYRAWILAQLPEELLEDLKTLTSFETVTFEIQYQVHYRAPDSSDLRRFQSETMSVAKLELEKTLGPALASWQDEEGEKGMFAQFHPRHRSGVEVGSQSDELALRGELEVIET